MGNTIHLKNHSVRFHKILETDKAESLKIKSVSNLSDSTTHKNEKRKRKDKFGYQSNIDEVNKRFLLKVAINEHQRVLIDTM